MNNMQILIDFPPGAHGNFLEFVLNKCYYQADYPDPFTNIGTSHNKPYDQQNTKFFADHFTRHKQAWLRKTHKKNLQKNNDIILIIINPSDLLMLSENSLLRAGDFQIQYLEINTYNKLNNNYYNSLLNLIIDSYKLDCSPNNPDIPRYILREVFKFGFKTPDIHGFIIDQKIAIEELTGKNIFQFPLDSFYSCSRLVQSIEQLSEYFKLDLIINSDEVKILHDKFLNKIPNLNIKLDCDIIIDAIRNKKNIEIPELSLFQESYINGILEKTYNKEMPFKMEKYFTSTQQCIEYLNEI